VRLVHSWRTISLLARQGAACCSTFSLIIACVVKARERFMGIGQALIMPLFFACNAIYPIALMPAADAFAPRSPHV